MKGLKDSPSLLYGLGKKKSSTGTARQTPVILVLRGLFQVRDQDSLKSESQASLNSIVRLRLKKINKYIKNFKNPTKLQTII